MTAAGPFKNAGAVDIRWVVNRYELAFAKEGLTGIAMKSEDSRYHVVGGLGAGKYAVGLLRFEERDRKG